MTVTAGLACVWAVAWVIAAGVLEPGISRQIANSDFANYWVAAKMVFAGDTHDLFQDQPTYFAHMQAFFGSDYPWHNWSYPPHYLLTIVPLGLMDYKMAMVVYLLTTFILFCGSLHLMSRDIRISQLLLLIPAVLCNVVATQNGFLTAALLLTGLAARDSRPVLAGICIGFLTIKPQLGYLLPLLLFAERKWLVIAVASGTALLLGATSVVAFGIESWIGYIENVIPNQVDVLKYTTGIFQHMIPSIYGSFRSLNETPQLANLVHMPVAFCALVLFGFSLLRLRKPQARAASLVFATFVISPYNVVYDLVALSAVVALWPKVWATTCERLQTVMLFLISLLPIATVLLGLAGFPVTPFIIIAGWMAFLFNEGAFTRRSTPAKA